MSLPKNIILIGFMGAGKTSTAKELSNLLKYHFCDMDQWIEEKNGKKIAELFAEKGEKYFRVEEKNAINWLKSKENYVVSTGGGAWIDSENREMLLNIGLCIWLKVSPEKSLERIKNHLNQRPLLSQSQRQLKDIKEIMSNRNHLYNLAHLSFDSDQKNPKEMAVQIMEVIKQDKSFDLYQLQK